LAISYVVKSVTYKHRNHLFRFFRQSRYIPQVLNNQKITDITCISVILWFDIFPHQFFVPRLYIRHTNPHFSQSVDVGYTAIHLQWPKFFRLVDLICTLPISIKQMADTIWCGPPLSFYFGMRGKESEDRILELLDMIELPDRKWTRIGWTTCSRNAARILRRFKKVSGVRFQVSG